MRRMEDVTKGSLVGLWVEIPAAGNCIAHVVRQRGPVLFVYYFEPTPGFDINTAEPGDAFDAHIIGYLGIRGGEWPALGRTPVDPAVWPVIEHAKTAATPDSHYTHFAIRLADDLATEVARRRISAEEAARMPPYGVSSGHQAAEYEANRLMKAGPRPMRSYTWWAEQFNAPPPIAATHHPELRAGVRIVIPAPWTGDIKRLLRRLERAIPIGDEVDGWEYGSRLTIFLYGRDSIVLAAATLQVCQRAGVPPGTELVGTDSEGEARVLYVL